MKAGKEWGSIKKVERVRWEWRRDGKRVERMGRDECREWTEERGCRLQKDWVGGGETVGCTEV